MPFASMEFVIGSGVCWHQLPLIQAHLPCGTFLNNASDLCKAAQLIRIEEIAADLGIEVTMDMVPEDRLQGTGVRRTPAGTPGHEVQRASRSGINILKANAKSHVQKADKMSMTVSQRQLVDAFYAFNCAAQDLSNLHSIPGTTVRCHHP